MFDDLVVLILVYKQRIKQNKQLDRPRCVIPLYSVVVENFSQSLAAV